MNIASGYSATSSYSGYNTEKTSQTSSKLPFKVPISEQTFNEHSCDNSQDGFKYIKTEEDEDDKKEGMVDYLLEALKGEEKNLRMEGNSYMDKLQYLMIHYKDLMTSPN